LTNNAELALMRTIRETWVAEITAAVEDTGVPERFLAALIANESGGNANAERLEPNVLAELSEVLLGKRAAYAGIHSEAIMDYVALADPHDLFPQELARLVYLATSHGLTQIMGWHLLAKNKTSEGNFLEFTVELLRDFADEFRLNLSSDFEQLFRCWNSGKPDGKTFDPNYVPNGLERMSLYAELADT
jgi:hypothetical protein